MFTPDQIQILAARLAAGTVSEAERNSILFYLESARREDAETFLDKYHAAVLKISVNNLSDEIVDAEIQRLSKQIIRHAPVRRVHFLKTTWFRYAAAIILVLGIAAYFWSTHKKIEQSIVSGGSAALTTNIAPGRDRAILTLANGQQIILDSTQGNIVKQGSLTVVNLAGKLKYEGVGVNAEYNTISTPRGGQYQIVLPDGSRVWLNAASSIKFPTAFTGNARKVEMTGEAYMEIEKNPNQSFVVTANGTQIQVLGTSFNINAYEDENAITTTLIEGSVKVVSDTNLAVNNKSNQTRSAVEMSPKLAEGYQQLKMKMVILKPGQQCSITNDRLLVTNNADIDQALAWKNGIFRFDKVNLEEVMRQLTRWYDIEVIYENGMPSIRLRGEIERNFTLSQMLDALGELGVKFRMEGKRLIIKQ